MNVQYDVVIVGGGLVGLAMAAALQRSALKVALVESRTPDLGTYDEWDTRVYAISPGSQKFIVELGVWQQLDAARMVPITRMEIAGDAGGMIMFDAFDAGVSALASIVEDSALRRAFWQTIDAAGAIDRYVPAAPSSFEVIADTTQLQLDSGERLSARLVVAADGGDSWLRRAANIDSTMHRYAAQGLVANFRVLCSHQGVARQWFRDDSVLAWLPLPNNHISIVWATPAAGQLAALSAQALARSVQQNGSDVLGELELVNTPAVFPLQLLQVMSVIGERVALIGDAAHSVHPLAGQGINLGFLDAKALAAKLTDTAARGDCGHAGLLRGYARARKADVLAMQAATHGLQKLFAQQNPLLRGLRNHGLDLTNSQAWLKALFMRHAFG